MVNMNRIKELKQELGSRYFFEKRYEENEVTEMQKLNPQDFPETAAASLTAGCLKIDAVLYHADGRLLLGYDVFVKDDADAEEWICYDSLTDSVSLEEKDMLNILDRVVEENELSYTESSFETLDGKIVALKGKEQTMSL